MIAALFSVLLLAPETPAATAETASPTTQEAATTAQPVEKAEKSKKICGADPANTGSRMPRKLCLTEIEWEKRAAGRSAGDLKTIGAR